MNAIWCRQRGKWVVLHPNCAAQVIGSGKSKIEAEDMAVAAFWQERQRLS